MNFINLFSFIVLLFMSCLRNSFHIPDHKEVLLFFFSSRSLIVLPLTFMVCDQFWVSFCIWYDVWIEVFGLFLFCFVYSHPIVTITFIENIVLPLLSCFGTFVEKSIKNGICVGLFLNSTVSSYFMKTLPKAMNDSTLVATESIFTEHSGNHDVSLRYLVLQLMYIGVSWRVC